MLFVSPSILDLTGYTPDEFIEQHIEFTDLILKSDQQMIITTLTNAVTEKGVNTPVEYRIRHRNGATVWILEKGSFDFNNTDVAQWIDGVLVDITERKEYEAKLEHAKLQAEEAANAKQSFMANMSHEDTPTYECNYWL